MSDDVEWKPSHMRLSPSKINTYMKCPREFYYKYIAKMPEKKNNSFVSWYTCASGIRGLV